MSSPTNRWRSYDVRGRRDEAEGIVTFTLSPPDAPARAGHHLIIAAPVGETQVREYSLSAIRPDAIEITVKREGLVSTWLHDHVAVGDTLTASLPRGTFLLGEGEEPLVLLSCGIGVTPMIAMAEEALERGRSVYFFHVARDRAHHALSERVDRLRRSGALVAHLTYKHGADASECDHLGEFTAAELSELLPSTSAEVKICGPKRFMQAMYDASLDLGVPEENIGWEAFGPSTVTVRSRKRASAPADLEATDTVDPDADQGSAGETAPLVRFAESDLTLSWDPDSGSLLDFAEEHCVFPNFACRQGSCESCMTSVKSGAFEYIDEPFETPPDGYVLLCCSRPLSDIELAI